MQATRTADSRSSVFDVSDGEDDLWWEVEPDVFVCARSLTQAREYRREGEGRSLERITSTYGVPADVTHLHPEINEGA